MKGIANKRRLAACAVAIVAVVAPTSASAGKKPKKPNFTVADVTVVETDAAGVQAEFTVKASKPSKKKPLKVSYATSDGTATAPADYATATGTLTFKKKVKTQTFAVSVVGDDVDENDESFTVTLSKPKGAKIKDGTATGTITDNDDPPVIVQGIEGARAAADGPVQAVLDDVVVTHLKPAIGTEAAGFFVQKTQAGPALFIEEAPTGLTPALAEGDVVDFTITQMATRDQARLGTTITGLSRSATGQSVGALAKDVSASTDLVSALDSYESEVVDLTGTVTGDFVSSGTGYVAAPISTTGLPSSANLRLRLPAALPDTLDIGQGCSVTLNDQPLVQFGSIAAASAWVATDVIVTSCPAARLVSASAPSTNDIQLNFDRRIDPTTVDSDGSQFTVDGLEITSAVANESSVSLTSSPQADQIYIAEVASSVEDTRGQPIDPEYDSIEFQGNAEPEPVDSITEARQTPDGATSIQVDDAIVTYVKPAVGSEAAGFFVQMDAQGPGLFVATLPSLTPALAAGDYVSFTITAMGTQNSMRRATSITGITRTGTGADLASLTQNVSNKADLVSALSDYDSELIDLDAQVKETPTAAGGSYVQARISTAAISIGELYLRVPTSIQDATDLSNGCTIDLNHTPLWISGNRAQPTAWRAADIVADCPAPRVSSATGSGTSVTVTFDRKLKASTLLANGSQFSIPGTTVTAAVLDGESRVVLTTGTLTAGQVYTVTVSGSLKDKLGDGIDPANNSAQFGGPDAPSSLLINEIAPNITDGRDLIELRATSAGNTEGMEIWTDGAGFTAAKLATLPDLQVQSGDLVIVHLNPIINVTTESTSKTSCTDGSCFSGAYDVRGGGSQANYSGDRVMSLYTGDRSTPIIDTVPLYRTTTTTSGFPSEVQAIQGAGAWLPANCGGEACTFSTTPTVEAISVPWDGAGMTTSGATISRKPVPDTNTAADWYSAATASSLGSVNP